MKKKPAKKPESPAVAINEVLGVRLHAPTLQRQSVAVDMGMKRGSVIPYRAAYLFHDTIVLLYLCSLSDVDEAEADPQKAVKDARKWAEKLGIGINTPAWHKAWPVFWAMIQKIESAKGQPVIPKDATREDTPGEL